MGLIYSRLVLLREAMIKKGVSACIIPGTDPHASEYIADYWKEREWISGFDGSAGTAIVTLNAAALWTDSRYFLQASEQLEGTEIELMKLGLPETLDIVPWLCSVLNTGCKVGVNAQMFSVNRFAAMKAELQMSNIELVSIDLLEMVWIKRPSLPLNPFYVFETKYSGKSATEKLSLLRAEMQKSFADVFVISELDDIAWLFNIRGKDVDFNPVVIAYALIEKEKATLFVSPEKLTYDTTVYLQSHHIDVLPYTAIYDQLKSISPTQSVLADGGKLNQALFESIPHGCTIRNSMSPVFKLKSVKNNVEIAGVRLAMLKDGVALTRFFIWLEDNLKSGNLSEISISDKLHWFRSKELNFVGESFETIAGYASHGAIVHYHPSSQTDFKLKTENILLLDSGGQYLDGTTDITRTIALGLPTAQQKTDYTLVLKGHIAIATAHFPDGTRGAQLDILARKAMWDLGLNYGHGTGHGVGHFLCVHEGPQSIRMDENPTPLQEGMILSNEPGMYRTNEYGIRIENLIHVVAAQKTEFGQFLKFETLTLFPIDQQLINFEMLCSNEIEWLNNYHLRVFETISPKLNDYERAWLSAKCEQYLG